MSWATNTKASVVIHTEDSPKWWQLPVRFKAKCATMVQRRANKRGILKATLDYQVSKSRCLPIRHCRTKTKVQSLEDRLI